LPVPKGNLLQFKVLRGETDIGRHVMNFERSGNVLTVKIAIDLAVKVGPITVFRYSHRGTETWEGDEFTAFNSDTDNDGKPAYCRIRRGAEGLVVEGDRAPRYTAPGNALATTYWNIATLKVPLINSQDGRLMQMTVKDLGQQAVSVASGAEIQATRYSLSGLVPLDIWYDAAPSWAHLLFYRGGDTSSTPIIYERL
jgi:hypothetical protein